MEKLFLVSIIPGAALIAVWAAADLRPRRGFKRGVYGLVAFVGAWAFTILYLVPRL